MARPSKPWFRKSKRRWYVTLHGRKVCLGADRDRAFKEYHRLMAGVDTATVGPGVEPTVRQLADDYMADLKGRVGTRTHYVAAAYLKRFLSVFGTAKARQLTRRQVGRWLAEQTDWSPSTANHVGCRLSAMYNWAVREDVLPANPLRGMTKPRGTSRGAETVVAADAVGRLMDAAPPYLRDVLTALHDTGARPCEVLTVTAAEFHPDQAVWVLRRHKTEHVTGRPRVVHLTPRVCELCARLAIAHPEGPLFRTARGKPFPPAYYLARLVRDLRRRVGLPESVIPYGLRHSFATDALAGGVPDAIVAQLMGHAGTAMLHKHYSHLTEQARALRGGLEQVRGG